MRINGVSRVADNEKAVCLYFDRKLSDDELRRLHDYLRTLNPSRHLYARRREARKGLT